MSCPAKSAVAPMSLRAASVASSCASVLVDHADVSHVHLLTRDELLARLAGELRAHAIGHGLAVRGAFGAGEYRQSIHRDHAGDLRGVLRGECQRQCAAEAVTHEHGLAQVLFLDQREQVGLHRIQRDASLGGAPIEAGQRQ